MVHLGAMKTHFLPSWCHWVCNMAMPLLDYNSGQYVEPFAPYLALGIVDMPGNTRSEEFNVPASHGGFVHTSLRYGSAKKATAAWQEKEQARERSKTDG